MHVCVLLVGGLRTGPPCVCLFVCLFIAYHDRGYDGDQGVAVRQEALGGLRTTVRITLCTPVFRETLQEGVRLTPLSLLHPVRNGVFNDLLHDSRKPSVLPDVCGPSDTPFCLGTQQTADPAQAEITMEYFLRVIFARTRKKHKIV